MKPFSAQAAFATLLICAIAGVGLGQGRYAGKKYSKKEVDRIIVRVEEKSDDFQKAFDATLDDSSLDGTRAEDRLNERVKDLEKALDDLRDDFDRQDSWWESRNQVSKYRDEAEHVNRIMYKRRFPSRLEVAWANLRKDLNRLLGIYNLPLIR